MTAINSEQLNRLPSNRDLLGIFNYHNQLRAEFGSAPLRWNPDLAAGAAAYGQSLSQGGTLTHASREGRKTIRENLLQSPRGVYSPMRMVQIWGSEKKLFRPGTFPNVSTDGNWESIAHFTQMVWPTTTDIGCAIHSDRRFDWLICRYSPPGNKDGTAIAPGLQLAQTQTRKLCNAPGGGTIPCGNTPEEGGGIIDDGGGDKDSGVKEEVACVVNVNVHRPISVAPDEPVIPEERELTPGATTLRNDDADWLLRGDGGTGKLPIITVRTDVDRTGNPNENENDLVKVIGINPNNLPGVYLFAFPTHAEADHKLRTTEVAPVPGGRQANTANTQELGYFSAATKADPQFALPLLIEAKPATLWVEAKLGGRYRMVIGKLAAQVHPRDVRYDRETGAAYVAKTRQPAFICEDQATITAAVVDIHQRNGGDDSQRLTAFDVYWGGRPHFHAEVWPGGQAFSWGEPYRLGAAVHRMPGVAVNDEKVAWMAADAEDVSRDHNAESAGQKVFARGNAPGSFTAKGRIEGGFQMARPGDPVPTVNTDVGNRYRDRVSLQYRVNDENLVRAEYLEVILPKVKPPAARVPKPGTAAGVSSDVQYSIVDAFDRDIIATDIADYLYLYGAGLKAWEALSGQDGRVVEAGPTKARDTYNDYLFLTNTGTNQRGEARPWVGPLGTAQRSQTRVREDRMEKATFQDTLVFTAPDDPDDRRAVWKAATGRLTAQSELQAQAEAKDRHDALNNRPPEGKRYRSAEERRDELQARRQAVGPADDARIARSNVLSIEQDVILQLRVGTERDDLMVFERNVLTVLAPYFLDSGLYHGNKNHPVFLYHMRFAPGRPASRIVESPHRRP